MILILKLISYPNNKISDLKKRSDILSFIGLKNGFSLSFIKKGKSLDSQISKLIDTFPTNPIGAELPISFAKRRGVSSSVPIAAAVTAYARINLNQYLNLTDNVCVYSN
jgi:hypothetical protein